MKRIEEAFYEFGDNSESICAKVGQEHAELINTFLKNKKY